MFFDRALQRPRKLRESFFDLRGDFQRKSVQALAQRADVAHEVIIKNYRWDGGKESSRRGDQSFGNAWRNSAQAGGAGSPEAGESVNDAPNGAEEADEWCDRPGGGQPGHAFFHAANFFRRSELHTDRDGAYAFERRRMRVAGGRADLALQF